MNQNQAQTKKRLDRLKAEIDSARKRLQALWDERGCIDYDILTVSAALDELINEYNRLTIKKGR